MKYFNNINLDPQSHRLRLNIFLFQLCHGECSVETVSLLQLLCLIGEGFGPYSRDVCGAVINVRAKGDKIAVWTTNTENAEAVTHIG